MADMAATLLALAAGDPGIKSWYAGTHRVAPLQATLARVEALLSTLQITRIAGLTGLDQIGIPVFMSVRPASRSVAVSLGKGLDPLAAKASAVMEAIETWHAERLTLPVKYASADELHPEHRMIDIERLPHAIGRPWRPDLRLLWCEALDLFSGNHLWLPFELVHTDYTLPSPAGSGLFAASTNGLASGNHVLEALSHALCEVIERDATAKWQRLAGEERAARRLRLQTIDHPMCEQVVEQFAAAGLEPLVWDTTSKVGIPAFACVVVDGRDPDCHPGFGAGCHPCCAVALSRALLEAAQVRLTYIAGARDDLSPSDFGTAALARKRRLLAALEVDGRNRRYGDIEDVRHDTCLADVLHILARLNRAGHREVAFLDLTRADIGIPVVRVVVPGLEVENSDLGGSRRQRAGTAP